MKLTCFILLLLFQTGCINTSPKDEKEATKRLINELETTSLTEIKKVAAIPDFIKNAVAFPINDSTMANPGEEWSAGCSAQEIMVSCTSERIYDAKLGDSVTRMTDIVWRYAPGRLLTYFGMGKKIALLKYYSGGVAKMEHTLIFKFRDTTISEIHEPLGPGLFKDDASKQEIINHLRYWNSKLL